MRTHGGEGGKRVGAAGRWQGDVRRGVGGLASRGEWSVSARWMSAPCVLWWVVRGRRIEGSAAIALPHLPFRCLPLQRLHLLQEVDVARFVEELELAVDARVRTQVVRVGVRRARPGRTHHRAAAADAIAPVKRAVLWSAWLGPPPTQQSSNDKVRGLAYFKSEFRAQKMGKRIEAKAYFNCSAHRCPGLGCVWLQYWGAYSSQQSLRACVRACPPCQSALLLRLYDFLATMLRSLVFRLVLP